MPPLRTVLSDLVDRLPDAIERVDCAIMRARARSMHIERSYMRGRGCHCDPTSPVHLLHSEGLREACDFVVDFTSNVVGRGRRQIPVDMLADAARGLEAGDRVYVKADRLPEFVRHVLPAIHVPFVLVTGDSDYGSVRECEHLLADPRIMHWFAQNCDVAYEHPRLTRIPIGIDNPRFNRLEKRLGFLVSMLRGRTAVDGTCTRNEMGDQVLLQRVRAQGRRRLRDKPLRVLGAFSMRRVPDRWAAREQLEGHAHVHFVPRWLSQETCWRLKDEFAFELSPRGNGLDCFRTWECLYLETIPIVRTSTLDPLYQAEGFPVVVVESFREITAERLEHWRDELADRFDDALLRHLTVDYWLDRIEVVRRAPPREPEA